MNRQLTLAQVLSIFVPVWIIVLGWGFTLSSTVEKLKTENDNQDKKIIFIEERLQHLNDMIDENFKILQQKHDNILYELRRIK
jgi:hypothetical protein